MWELGPGGWASRARLPSNRSHLDVSSSWQLSVSSHNVSGWGCQGYRFSCPFLTSRCSFHWFEEFSGAFDGTVPPIKPTVSEIDDVETEVCTLSGHTLSASITLSGGTHTVVACDNLCLFRLSIVRARWMWKSQLCVALQPPRRCCWTSVRPCFCRSEHRYRCPIEWAFANIVNTSASGNSETQDLGARLANTDCAQSTPCVAFLHERGLNLLPAHELSRRQPTRHARDHSTTKWCASFWSWPPRRWHLQHHTTLAHETKRHASAQAEASSITGMIVNSHQQPFHDGQNIHPHNWEAWTESSTSRFQKTLPSTTNVASELLHKHHMFLKSQNTFHLRTSALCWSFFSRITLKARCTLKPRDSRTKWSRPVHDPRSSRERKSTCCTSWWGTPVENHTVLFQCWPLSRWRWTWSLRKRGESRHTSNRGTPQWQCAVRCQQQMHLGA